jgi:hypothetical protein
MLLKSPSCLITMDADRVSLGLFPRFDSRLREKFLCFREQLRISLRGPGPPPPLWHAWSFFQLQTAGSTRVQQRVLQAMRALSAAAAGAYVPPSRRRHRVIIAVIP